MRNILRSITFLSLALSGVALFLLASRIRVRYSVLIVACVIIYLIIAWAFLRKSDKSFRKWIEIVGLQIVPLFLSGLTLFYIARTERGFSPKVNFESVNNKIKNIEREFNDLQNVQVRSAKRNGVSPIATREEASEICDRISQKGGLEKISSNEYYNIGKLDYSCPYLVPDAKILLEDCAKEFQKILDSKSKIIVTSVLRTREDVKKLQKVNSNATTNSCHCYGTTFDLSYTAFKKDLFDPRSDEELRLALAKALSKLRKEGRCYVKFEKAQKCYHITVR